MKISSRAPVMQFLRKPPLLFSIAVATLSGFLYGVSFPETAVWPLSFVGIMLFFWTLRGRGWWTGLLTGLCFGIGLWFPLIDWLTLYLGPIPWIGLAGFQSLYLGVLGGAIALIYRFHSLIPRRNTFTFILLPLVLASLWVARESIAGRWPWGGFAWARLSVAQVNGPLGASASWLGGIGLSFICAWIAAALSVWICERPPVLYVGITLAVVAGVIFTPLFPVNYTTPLRIAAVQGNTKSGLFDVVHPGDNLIAHQNATLDFVQQPVDLIVWPENASDVDPLTNRSSAMILSALSNKYDAPLLVGTITSTRDGAFYNSALLWNGRGAVAQYDKVHPVPFAEYMPIRNFFHALVPDLVDLVTRDYSFGTRPNVMEIDGTKVAVSICFDIVDDDQTTALVRDGAGVIISMTNNADFGYTDESAQQLDIAKLRALESGLYVVNISTVGTSAVISPNGHLLMTLPAHQAGALNANVPVSAGAALGARTNPVWEVLADLIALIAVSGAIYTLVFSKSIPRRARRYSKRS